MLINSPDCSTGLFSWYGLLIMVGGDLSQTLVYCVDFTLLLWNVKGRDVGILAQTGVAKILIWPIQQSTADAKQCRQHMCWICNRALNVCCCLGRGFWEANQLIDHVLSACVSRGSSRCMAFMICPGKWLLDSIVNDVSLSVVRQEYNCVWLYMFIISRTVIAVGPSRSWQRPGDLSEWSRIMEEDDDIGGAVVGEPYTCDACDVVIDLRWRLAPSQGYINTAGFSASCYLVFCDDFTSDLVELETCILSYNPEWHLSPTSAAHWKEWRHLWKEAYFHCGVEAG